MNKTTFFVLFLSLYCCVSEAKVNERHRTRLRKLFSHGSDRLRGYDRSDLSGADAQEGLAAHEIGEKVSDLALVALQRMTSLGECCGW